MRTVLRQCANLRAFEITDGGEHLTGLGWGSKDDPEAPAEANALIALRLARVPADHGGIAVRMSTAPRTASR